MDDDILANLVNFKAVRELALKRKKKNTSEKTIIGKKSPKNVEEKESLEKSISNRNKNKGKILQTQTFQDSKNKEKKEIVVKTKQENENTLCSTKAKKNNLEKGSPSILGKEPSFEFKEPNILGKRNIENLNKKEEIFLKFGSKDDLEDTLTIKGEGLQSIDEAFNNLKKIKKENSLKKNAKEMYSNQKQSQNTDNHIFEETERHFAPWMSKSTGKIENPIIRFHNEIIDFVDYIGPSQKEDSLRKKSFEKFLFHNT